MKKIIFVCAGNTCRSPMAEGLFKKFLADNGIGGIDVKSAGAAAYAGGAPSKNAVAAAAEAGADISSHRSAPLTRGDMESADLIVAMSNNIGRALTGVGLDEGKLLILDVADPYGGDLDTYRRCRDEISAALPGIAEIIGGRDDL